MDHPLLSYLKDLHRRFADLDEGEVAGYIPELSKAAPRDFGIVLVTTDGEVYATGECERHFTIQSISKAFVYATALADKGEEQVLKKVYVEPTGDAFNSISLHPQTGAPLNPMINAGAIATAGLVSGATAEQQWQRILGSLSAFAGRPLEVDEAVYRSESETGFRNRAIGWMLRNFGILEDDPTPVVENYFRQCSLRVSCRDLGLMGATLANGGVHPLTGERVISPQVVASTLSVMSTCGMYDYAGAWLFEVGLPAKSGVGGGIVAVMPGRFALATYSPPLDEKGNSVRGIAVCRQASRDLGLHLMDANRNASLVLAARYNGREFPSNRRRPPLVAARLQEEATAIQILSLRGDLSLDGMERVVRLLLADTNLKHAVLDLHRATTISAPAARLLHRARADLEATGRSLVLSRLHAPSELAEALDLARDDQAAPLVFPDNDHAVEWCEEQLLAQLALASPVSRADALGDFDFFAGLTVDETNALSACLMPADYGAGDIIVHAGDDNDDRLFLVRRGEVSVLLPLRDGTSQRLATLGAGMVFGEMALFDRKRRSASVRADSAVECWVLRARDLDTLARDLPGLKIALLQNLSRALAERLQSQANSLVAALTN